MTPIHHSINYVEFAAADLSASKAFYADVFGWSFNDYGDAYAGIRSPDGDGEVGGLDPQSRAGEGTPLVVVYSDDLDRTLAAVRSTGAAVTLEPYEFPGGRRFHFKDPAGNELAVWSAS